MYSVWAKFWPSVTVTDNTGVSSWHRISYAELPWISALMQVELSMRPLERVWHGNLWQQNLAPDLFKWRTSHWIREERRREKIKTGKACLLGGFPSGQKAWRPLYQTNEHIKGDSMIRSQNRNSTWQIEFPTMKNHQWKYRGTSIDNFIHF